MAFVKRPTAVIPVLVTLVAFILSLLCIFAGSKRGYLESANLVTLNTSMLGQNAINEPKTSSTVLNKIGSGIQKEANKAVADIAKDLNIHDFYSAHLLDYCEGYYTPSPVSNSTSHPSKNVTHCSDHMALFHFDPTAILQKELKPGVNLTDLKWPSAIKDAIKAVEIASKAMFVTYCFGTATTGLALIGALVGVLDQSRLVSAVNFMIAMLASFSLMIASAISTGLINKVVDTVNAHGKDIGVAAYKGKHFIGMTWAATILVLYAGLAWVYEFLKKPKQETYIIKELEDHEH